MTFELPKLKYSFQDLEPYIDAQTVEIHYTKHHQTYITNLNKVLGGQDDLVSWPAEQLLAELSLVPETIRTVVQNNGGGYLNHNLYWALMSKTPQSAPTGILLDSINTDLGGLDKLKA